MTQKRDKKTEAESQTGAIPRMDFKALRRREPAKPPTLPEFEDTQGGITGIIHVRPEGEDSAKDEDDTPTKSALTS